jgi:hypothetical protein
MGREVGWAVVRATPAAGSWGWEQEERDQMKSAIMFPPRVEGWEAV